MSPSRQLNPQGMNAGASGQQCSAVLDLSLCLEAVLQLFKLRKDRQCCAVGQGAHPCTHCLPCLTPCKAAFRLLLGTLPS